MPQNDINLEVRMLAEIGMSVSEIKQVLRDVDAETIFSAYDDYARKIFNQ